MPLYVHFQLLEVYEVWHFDETDQYDGIHPETGLFTKYINAFLKKKLEASGYPDYVETEEDKENYIQTCYEREGVTLDKANIKKNPGLRSLAKLCLNSFWGKVCLSLHFIHLHNCI